jgi:hypothetical protein
MPGPQGEECSRCYYFEKLDDFGPGFCHRFPPAVWQSDGDPVVRRRPLPVTWRSEWCGEFKPAQRGPSAP